MTFTKVVLQEEVAKASLGKISSSGRWLTKLITPGEGSTGKYSQEALAESIKKAFPIGSHSYVGHPEEDENGNPKRNPKDLLGSLATEPYWSDTHSAFVGEIQVLEHWRSFVDEVAPHTGMSIYALGLRDTETGDVVELLPDPFNSIDLVSYAGRGGALVEQLYESAVRHSESNSGENASAEDKEGKEMTDIADLGAKLDAFGTKFDALVTALTPAAPSEDDGPDYAAVAEAVVAESLTPKLRSQVFARVKEGATVDEAVAEAKAIADEINEAATARLQEEAGRVGNDGAGDDFSVGRWS